MATARMPTIGELDRRVTLERPLITRDAATGAQLVAWPVLDTVWAQVLESAPADDEEQRTGVLTYSRPTRIRLRWRADVEPTLRVRLDDGVRLLQITGTAQLGRREFLELACREWSIE